MSRLRSVEHSHVCVVCVLSVCVCVCEVNGV